MSDEVMLKGVKTRRCGSGLGSANGRCDRIGIMSSSSLLYNSSCLGLGRLEKGRKMARRLVRGGCLGGGGRGALLGLVEVRSELKPVSDGTVSKTIDYKLT